MRPYRFASVAIHVRCTRFVSRFATTKESQFGKDDVCTQPRWRCHLGEHTWHSLLLILLPMMLASMNLVSPAASLKALNVSHPGLCVTPYSFHFGTCGIPTGHFQSYNYNSFTTTESCRKPVIRRPTWFVTPKNLDRWQHLQTSCAISMPPETNEKSGDRKDRPIGVLFVCLGNICRSPTAEALFRSAVSAKGLDTRFHIDSAGTDSYHEGDLADARMRGAAIKRGVALTSRSRPIRREDFEEFDIILAMDRSNVENIRNAFRRWNAQKPLPPGSEEKVLDLLEDACAGLLASLEPRL